MKKIICLLFLLFILVGCQDKTNKTIDNLNNNSNFEYNLLTEVTDEIKENFSIEYGFGMYRLVDSSINDITETELNNYLLSNETTFYTVTAYPDYSDGGEYITRVETTDTNVEIYGFCVGKIITIDDVTQQMKEIGFIPSSDNNAIYSNGSVSIQLYINDVIYKIDVSIEISNVDDIVF